MWEAESILCRRSLQRETFSQSGRGDPRWLQREAHALLQNSCLANAEQVKEGVSCRVFVLAFATPPTAPRQG